ncbi:MAG: hypothetical protein NC417_03000 [Candidatus Gastranaerophilales bacterium]|nr:hypothetical protein [Candidatus Gastranaerophilales bacterium]
MGNKFTILKGQEDIKDTNRVMRTIAFHDCWERQYHNSILQAIEKNKGIKIADYPQDDLMRISLSGIKYINSIREIRRENTRLGTDYVQTLEEAQVAFQLIDAIFTVCGYLTLRNFVNTFPIEKDYSGEKWQCKDYFSTMEVLSKMDWDKPIGKDELSELLWDYDNSDLRHAYVEFTTAMSAIYRAQTGKGIAETWCEDMGIPTYTVYKDTGIMKNNQTGDIMKPKKASHLHIVK